METMTKKETATDLREAVIVAYRRSLEGRYARKNIDRFPEFAVLPDEIIDEIRAFFLDHLYPTHEGRKDLDNAFDRLGDVLKSPKKLMPLVGMGFKSIFKMGSLIPAAVKAGVRTLEAYLDIRKLERALLAGAEKQGLTPEQLMEDQKHLHALVREMPEKDIVRFRKEMNNLFKALSNTKLLKISLEILTDSKNIMKKREDLYTPQELSGLTLGHAMLEGGLDLYQKLDQDQVDLIHRGINTLEVDWYEAIKRGE